MLTCGTILPPPPPTHVNYYKTASCEPRRIHEWGECRNKESVQYQHKKVGILYIGLARYIVFWKDFYLSSEKYFLPGIEKQYFVFTDEEDKIEKKDNVTVYHQESLGNWVKNTVYRYKILLEHQEDYSDCDYLYFFNANTLFRKKVTPKEFIPGEKDNYLLCLSPTFYIGHHKDTWPYERRPESCAYIPYGEGNYYYQSAIFGGRRKEYLELLNTCNEWVQKDEENNIVARVVDESHINKYFLDKRIKVVDSKYGRGEDLFCRYCKIILRDKYKVLGDYYLNLKGWDKPEKFSFKRYSLIRFLRKCVNRVLFKYWDIRY
jgi:hypothetical protein